MTEGKVCRTQDDQDEPPQDDADLEDHLAEYEEGDGDQDSYGFGIQPDGTGMIPWDVVLKNPSSTGDEIAPKIITQTNPYTRCVTPPKITNKNESARE
eukprot:5122819-Amphidinium_carterae.1